MKELSFFKGKRVFITGHTGFKGSWLSRMLFYAGANVTGYSLNPISDPSLYKIAQIEQITHSIIGDLRDYHSMNRAFNEAKPEIVFHLAAQPIVREGYKNPKYTYETNVIGTVNILECIRNSNWVKSFLNVTTDKVYENNDILNHRFSENDKLDGYDPYSNSKSCSELITHSYKKSFFIDNPPISTARAGNVIGGGDFAIDRIIPDCVRAAQDRQDIIVRNPYSIRPYQHVLEPLYVYLLIAQKQYEEASYQGWYNVGPEDLDCFQTGALVDLFVKHWGQGLKWNSGFDGGPHEASYLKLDCSKLKKTFGWKPKWNLDKAVENTVEWSKCWLAGGDINKCMDKQIEEFLSE